ncbi:hypothetical protein Plhal304r1_c089g0171071 [Plasmopara halstedii]
MLVQKCLQLLHATGPADKVLHRLLRHGKPVLSNESRPYWLYLPGTQLSTSWPQRCTMNLILVLTDENPTYFSSLTIPPYTVVAQFHVAKDMMQYKFVSIF